MSLLLLDFQLLLLQGADLSMQARYNQGADNGEGSYDKSDEVRTMTV